LTVHCVALLGRKDQPTDAVEEYCRYLADALKAHDIQMDIRRVPWEIHGWKESLNVLKLMATQWKNTWVFVQYTALAWSARGFPAKVLRAMKILRAAGAHVAVVFHDVEPYPGTRLVDSIRRFAQARTMRRVLAFADLAIFTVLPEKLSWVPSPAPNHAAFIPVGPNLPIPAAAQDQPANPHNEAPTIGVFSITGGDSGTRETQFILSAVRYAAQKLGQQNLSVFGRHSELREDALKEGLRDLPVALTVDGVIEPSVAVQKLQACTLLLFVRGNISSRRSSAIAAVACSLPIIAFSGSETASPLSDAGVVLIPPYEQDLLNEALVRVLSDPHYRAELAARSRSAYNEHFSWAAIARRYASMLKDQQSLRQIK
jgi:glycosyltransferase involved in cell wall biosynthesis